MSTLDSFDILLFRETQWKPVRHDFVADKNTERRVRIFLLKRGMILDSPVVVHACVSNTHKEENFPMVVRQRAKTSDRCSSRMQRIGFSPEKAFKCANYKSLCNDATIAHAHYVAAILSGEK